MIGVDPDCRMETCSVGEVACWSLLIGGLLGFGVAAADVPAAGHWVEDVNMTRSCLWSS